MEPENNNINQNNSEPIIPTPTPTLEPLATASEPVISSNPILQGSAPVGPAQKSKKAFLIIIIIATLLIITGGIVLALIATGVISFGDSGPSSKTAEQVCAKYGGTFSSEKDEYAPDNLNSHITATYTCKPNDSSFDKNIVKFIIYVFDEKASTLDYFKENKILPIFGLLENSDTYYKAIVKWQSNYVSYSALYGYYYITLGASNIELAEDVLIELGFPDRNRTTTSKYEEEVNSTNALNQEIVNKVYEAILDYKTANGALPTIVPDEDGWQTAINGIEDTDFDKIYNSLGNLTSHDGEAYVIDAFDSTKDNGVEILNSGYNIVVKYGYYCATYGDAVYTEPWSDGESFTVTLTKTNGDIICNSPVFEDVTEKINQQLIGEPAEE